MAQALEPVAVLGIGAIGHGMAAEEWQLAVAHGLGDHGLTVVTRELELRGATP